MRQSENNSPAGINYYFQSGGWEGNRGREQTAYFMNLLLGCLPQTLLDWWQDASILNMGCAIGDGAALLAEAFPRAMVVGVDRSEAAIAKGRELYPDLPLVRGAIGTWGRKADVVICSNVLEHFTDPLEPFHALTTLARRSLAVLVPYAEEPRIAGHDATISEDTFPDRPRGFIRTFSRIINTAGSGFWDGRQLLQVWSRQ